MTTSGSKTVFTLANKITLMRILGVPLFILALFYYLMSVSRGTPDEYYRRLAFGLFLAAAITDAADGYLARRRNEITHLGRLLDPLADKALLLSAVIMLTRFHPPLPAPSFPPWFSLLVISRDAFLLVGAGVVHALTGGVEVHPRWVGKCATVLQMLAILWVLSGYKSAWFHHFLFAAALFTFVSGALYIMDGLRQIERASRTSAPP